MIVFKILELLKVLEHKEAENAFLFNASPWFHRREHSYSQRDMHYTSDNDHFIISHLKIILTDCPYLPN